MNDAMEKLKDLIMEIFDMRSSTAEKCIAILNNIKAIIENEEMKFGQRNQYNADLLAIETVPEVNQVRHGRWISVPHKKDRICSVCEHDEPYKFADEDANVFDYCPYCGAKMDAKEVWTYFD